VLHIFLLKYTLNESNLLFNPLHHPAASLLLPPPKGGAKEAAG